MTRPTLEYFSADEFGAWWPFMSADLLQKLDEFRRRWGAPVTVSGAHGALGRTGDGHSQHNVDRWGEVRAIDVFPKGMDSLADRTRAFDIAKSIGFTGIGIYTDTKPSNMLHLDVREDRNAGDPAKWSRVGGRYLGIDEVIA